MAVVEGNVIIGEIGLGVQQLTRKHDGLRSELRGGFRDVMAALKESKAEANQGKERKHIDKAKVLLQPSVSPVDIYTGIEKTRVPGTSDWIREEGLFQAWMNQDDPLLWLSGKPGSGKTYIAGT
jgi:hypothetical protein